MYPSAIGQKEEYAEWLVRRWRTTVLSNLILLYLYFLSTFVLFFDTIILG